MQKPTMDEVKMIWGFILLFALCFLIGADALGKVEQATSYGLDGMIGILGVLAGQWASWAFKDNKDKN